MMKNAKRKEQNAKLQRAGFTMVELLVVISILAILAVVSFPSLSSFNTAQQLRGAVLDVKNGLQYAKSQTINQVNTCPSGQQFLGYKFLACCSGGACPSCLSTKDYEVDISCSASSAFIMGRNLSAGVTIDVPHSTSLSFLFNVITGSVTGNGILSLKQGSVSKSITVSAAGGIQ